MGEQILYGSSCLKNLVPKEKIAMVWYPGKSLFSNEDVFGLTEDILNHHVLLLGGSGCGKTNTFLYTIQDLRKQMIQDDIMLIFDTKGEFYEKFGTPEDYIIGNSASFRNKSATWNIFGEVLADGDDPVNIKMNAREISAALFHGRGSDSQPFFCNAARDIFMGLLLHFIRSAKKEPEIWAPRLNNKNLTEALMNMPVEGYIRIFKAYEDLQFLLSYLGDGSSNQALGVFGELHSMAAEYFNGVFSDHNPNNSISMREIVRARGCKAIFVEYDISVGETLAPIYRLLVDQALKEALGRASTDSRLFLIADEFKLLPKLQHIDDALNFGRSLGVHVVAGIQSIDQLYDIYGKEKGAVIASGFGSLIAFHTNDSSSRDYITDRFGTNLVSYTFLNEANDSPYSETRNGHTVEIWDQLHLIVGQAVVGLGDAPPFVFRFSEYDKEV